MVKVSHEDRSRRIAAITLGLWANMKDRKKRNRRRRKKYARAAPVHRGRQRLDWAAFQAGLTEKEFQKLYKLSRGGFYSVAAQIKHLVAPNRSNLSSATGGGISTELQLATTLRFLAGGSYLDIRHHYGLGTSTFYDIVERVLLALDETL